VDQLRDILRRRGDLKDGKPKTGRLTNVRSFVSVISAHSQNFSGSDHEDLDGGRAEDLQSNSSPDNMKAQHSADEFPNAKSDQKNEYTQKKGLPRVKNSLLLLEHVGH